MDLQASISDVTVAAEIRFDNGAVVRAEVPREVLAALFQRALQRYLPQIAQAVQPAVPVAVDEAILAIGSLGAVGALPAPTTRVADSLARWRTTCPQICSLVESAVLGDPASNRELSAIYADARRGVPAAQQLAQVVGSVHRALASRPATLDSY